MAYNIGCKHDGVINQLDMAKDIFFSAVLVYFVLWMVHST